MKKSLIIGSLLFAGVLVGCSLPGGQNPSEINSVEGTPSNEVVSEVELSETIPSVEESSSEYHVEPGVVYFNPNGVVDWYIINCYAWDSNDALISSAWPGSSMQYDDKTGYYKYTLGEGVTSCNVIFNNGTAQTADLVYSADKPVYQLNGNGLKGEWTEVGVEVEVNIVEESPYYLKGSFDSWGAGQNFTKVSDDLYILQMDMAAGVEFKAATADWSWEANTIQGPAASNFSGGHGEYGNNLRCEVAGNYTFELTVSTKIISVSKNA